jgi:hypothetical protein
MMDTVSPKAAALAPLARATFFAREPGWQFSLALAIQVLFLFVAVPAFSSGDAGAVVITTLQFSQAIFSIALLIRSRALRLCFVASFGLTLLARFVPGPLPHGTVLSLTLLYNVIVSVAVARAVFGPGPVNYHRISGAIFLYLNTALIFAIVFSCQQYLDPATLPGLHQHDRGRFASLLHLSFTTLTTMGNSPLVPQTPFARSMADLETVIGQLFPAVLLGRLVNLHVSKAHVGRQ